MRAKTHLLGGAISSAVFCASGVAAKAELVPLIAAGALGGLFPDIDVPGSAISRSCIGSGIVSHVLRMVFGHRGFFHSLLCIALMALALRSFPIIPENLAAAFLAGALSHLALDSMTRGGVAWLWPIPVRIALPFYTGGVFESVLYWILWLAGIWVIGQLLLS
jgi:inner membrane protein